MNDNHAPPPIQLSGNLSLRDYKSAFRLHNLRSFKSRIVSWIALLFLFFFLFAAAIEFRRFSTTASNLVILAIVFIFGFPFLLWFFGNRILKKQEQKKVGIFLPTTMYVTPQGVIRVASGAQEQFEWIFFSGYRANESVVLLLIGHSKNYLILAFENLESPHQWEELQELVAAKLPPY